MSDPVIPPLGGDPAPKFHEQMELLRFLSEESRQNRGALRDEALAIRELFVRTSKIVAIPLTAAIVLAGIFFFHNLNEMKQEMVNEGRDEAKLEIQKMDRQIDDTLQDEFKTEKIQATIKSAAEAATQKEAKPLIEAEVKSRVGASMAQQGPLIQRITTQAVSDKVREAVTPLASQAREAFAANHVHDLIEKVNEDDANAFDELLLLRDKGTPDQQALIKTTIADREAYARENLIPGLEIGACGYAPSAFREELKQPDRAGRKRAIASCDPLVANDNASRYRQSFDQVGRVAPEIDLAASAILDIALHDRSLSVRSQAVDTINLWFQGAPGVPPDGFNLLEIGALSEWRKQNEANSKALLLLSRAKLYISQGWISVALYEEVKQLAPNTPVPLEKALDETLARMQSDAAISNTDNLARRAKEESCASAARDVEADFPNWDPSDPQFGFGRSERDQLAFLAACPIDAKLLPQVAEYAAKTRILGTRYWAVRIINKWAGLTLDPFDTRSIQGWWDKHKAEYQR